MGILNYFDSQDVFGNIPSTPLTPKNKLKTSFASADIPTVQSNNLASALNLSASPLSNNGSSAVGNGYTNLLGFLPSTQLSSSVSSTPAIQPSGVPSAPGVVKQGDTPPPPSKDAKSFFDGWTAGGVKSGVDAVGALASIYLTYKQNEEARKKAFENSQKNRVMLNNATLQQNADKSRQRTGLGRSSVLSSYL